MVRPLTEAGEAQPADASVARSGETLRQAEWRAELLKTGIRGKNKQMILFSRVEPLAGTRWLHADAESVPNERGADRVSEPRSGAVRSAERVVVSFGPEHAPLEQRQVELAWEEARTLSPRPGILAFAAFQFDAEAAKDIDELTREKTGMTFLKVQMNPICSPRTSRRSAPATSPSGSWTTTTPRPGRSSRATHGASPCGCSIPITMAGASSRARSSSRWRTRPAAWARLARNLKAEIDLERIEVYRGTVSLPFDGGDHKRVAVKIVDDRGIESLKIIPVS
jgi:adenine-specific DNA-methyltransferase